MMTPDKIFAAIQQLTGARFERNPQTALFRRAIHQAVNGNIEPLISFCELAARETKEE